jgi:hypothetical protein
MSAAVNLPHSRVAKLAAEIRSAGRTASIIDPANGFSYAAMAGCLQSILETLVNEAAGSGAMSLITDAFTAVYQSADSTECGAPTAALAGPALLKDPAMLAIAAGIGAGLDSESLEQGEPA